MILLLIFISLALGLSLKWHVVFVSIIASSLFIFLFFRFKKRIVLTSLVCFGLGIGISYISFNFSKESYSGVVVESKDNYYIFSSNLMKFYVYEKNNTYEVGDWLTIKGKKENLDFIMIESGFDFKTYLNKKGVDFKLEASKVAINLRNPIRLKEIRNKALSGLNKDTRSLVSAIIFSSLDDSSVAEDLKALHLMRLLSTSGIYIALFYKLLLNLFLLFFKEKISKVIATSFIASYAFLLFPKFNVLRFATFLIFKLINEYILKKKFDYLSLLSITGLFFIIIDYHLTYQISFILGFSFPIISYFLFGATRRFSKYGRKAISMLFIFIFLIPIDIYFYHEFSIFGYLFQIILTPLFMSIAVFSIFLIARLPIEAIMNHLINGVKNISYILGFLNIKIYAPPFNEAMYAIYILLYILLIYLFEIKFKPLFIYLNVGYFVIMTLFFVPLKCLLTTEVCFINVGQGDSCLIRKGNTAILIDTGGSTYKDIAKECLIPFFKKKQIYNIDLLITTHDDFDHSGAVNSLRNNFDVKNYIKEPEAFPLTINGITLTNYNNYQEEVSEENDTSLVIGFNLHNKDYLITGDAPKEIEYKIMADYSHIDCDILKVGHHGSNTSSSDTFIKYLSPEVGIISCGKNNKYGHPHKEVLNILKNNNVDIRRTDEEGSITYLSYF
ncbi:MAG: ComEC/Rec2 family competence protein [Bacilli bacterium]|nr:ComEC/Rec2 family competence protein [Bacilli bacterium]